MTNVQGILSWVLRMLRLQNEIDPSINLQTNGTVLKQFNVSSHSTLVDKPFTKFEKSTI